LSRFFPEPVGGRAKRILDLVIAVPVLVVLAPVFAVIAILIRRDSPGPAFYRQTRVGLDGREFRLIKFRTMIEAPSSLVPGSTTMPAIPASPPSARACARCRSTSCRSSSMCWSAT